MAFGHGRKGIEKLLKGLRFLKGMKGVIVNYRQGRHTIKHNHLIIEVDGVSDKEKASSLVGKKVVWEAPGKLKKQLTGKVASAHGGKGAIRVIFETGMPGQSLGKEVKIE